ncbi:hypothetical protein KKG90_06650 [Candidatus Bipolaricaulota bacterium]|nr:hypothetical protein [Candidatus Bipolaricaulota bacterium]
MAKKSKGMRTPIIVIALVALAFVSYLSVINHRLTGDINDLRNQVATLTAQLSEQETIGPQPQPTDTPEQTPSATD